MFAAGRGAGVAAAQELHYAGDAALGLRSYGGWAMTRWLLPVVFSVMIASGANAEKLKIGFVATTSGPGAVIGQDMIAGFKIGMKDAGLADGANAIEVIYEDDQLKPDVGRQATTKLIERDRVNLVTGMIWSNVLLASAKPVFDANAVLISANAGPSDLAGKQCNANFFGVAFQNDTLHEPGGQYAQNKGVKRLALIAPNYPAGKDALNGVKRYFKGEVATELYPALDQFDFAAELAQIRASKADAAYFFFAGAQAVSFLKQYDQSGLMKTLPLIGSMPSLDVIARSGVGAGSIGAITTTLWDEAFDNPTNKKFVSEFVADQKRRPSGYAATAYDTASLIGSALKKTNGDVADRKAFSKALAAADFASVRGAFKFNNNHYPVQSFYAGPIVADGNGGTKVGALEIVFKDHRDPFAEQCPSKD